MSPLFCLELFPQAVNQIWNCTVSRGLGFPSIQISLGFCRQLLQHPTRKSSQSSSSSSPTYRCPTYAKPGAVTIWTRADNSSHCGHSTVAVSQQISSDFEHDEESTSKAGRARAPSEPPPCCHFPPLILASYVFISIPSRSFSSSSSIPFPSSSSQFRDTS